MKIKDYFGVCARQGLGTVEKSIPGGIRQREAERDSVKHIAASEWFPWQHDWVLRQEFQRKVVFLSPQQEKTGRKERQFEVVPLTPLTATILVLSIMKEH